MSESKADDRRKECDPTEDATFKRVVQHFLKTPHKPHKLIKSGKPAKKRSQHQQG